MTTITASSIIGIKLTPASYTSPVVIEADVTISNPGYPDGIYTAPASTTLFAIQNEGTIIGAVTPSGVGVYLAPGGLVTNAASASITGYTGVQISGGVGTVVNDGSVTGYGQTGVDLAAGGSVTNAASASITAGYIGVAISGGTGVVVNDGDILTTPLIFQWPASCADSHRFSTRSGNFVDECASWTLDRRNCGMADG